MPCIFRKESCRCPGLPSGLPLLFLLSLTVLYRLKAMSREDLSFKPLVGLMAAVVFIISCMPVPVPFAGTCSHPCGTGTSGILVGPAISVVITAVALFIQAVLLAHGGLSTFGADVVSMGVMGSLAGYLTFKALRAVRVNMAVSGFMAGLFADWATYLTTAVELASGIKGESAFLPLFWKVLVAFVPTQLPLGILEGGHDGGHGRPPLQEEAGPPGKNARDQTR